MHSTYSVAFNEKMSDQLSQRKEDSFYYLYIGFTLTLSLAIYYHTQEGISIHNLYKVNDYFLYNTENMFIMTNLLLTFENEYDKLYVLGNKKQKVLRLLLFFYGFITTRVLSVMPDWINFPLVETVQDSALTVISTFLPFIYKEERLISPSSS